MRRRAPPGLAAEDAYLRIALAAGGFATWDWDIRTGAVAWNDEHYRMQGYSPGEVEPSYEAWLARVHPEDRVAAVAALTGARDRQQEFVHEFRTLHPDGTVRWCAGRGTFFYDETGVAVRMIGVMEDVTGRKETDEALRQRDARQKFLLKLADAVRPLFDPVEIVRETNRLLGEHLGADRVLYAEIQDGDFVVHQDYAAPGARSMAGRYPATMWGGEKAKSAFEHGEAILAKDVLASPIFDDFDRKGYEEFGIRGFLAVMLPKYGASGITLGVHSAAPREWTQAETRLVEEVAERTWAAVERARAVEELRASEEHARLLLAELQHRVRNTLGVIRSIVRRTAETSETAEELAMNLEGRIDAFARVQSAVTREPEAGIDLEYLIAEEMLVYGAHEGRRVAIAGPGVRLHPKGAEILGLTIHELATNAVKHGALSGLGGRIDIRWSLGGGEQPSALYLVWKESGVADAASGPSRDGFGTELLERTLEYELDATTTRVFERDGVRVLIELPLTPRLLHCPSAAGSADQGKKARG